MRNETVLKMARGRLMRPGAAMGQSPSTKARTNAAVGMTTKGSPGSKAHETTSTARPQRPVPNAFLSKLGEMYMAERELVMALPLLVQVAKSPDLKALLRLHLEQTRGHVKTLQKVARSLGQEIPSKSCPTITQLIIEATKIMAKRLVTESQDAELIRVGRKIEQFEIEGYEPRLCEPQMMPGQVRVTSAARDARQSGSERAQCREPAFR